MERITGAKPLTLAGRQITITTRYTNTQNNVDAAAYFHQRFTALGLSPFYQEFRYNSQVTRNVIGVKVTLFSLFWKKKKTYILIYFYFFLEGNHPC